VVDYLFNEFFAFSLTGKCAAGLDPPHACGVNLP